MKPSYDTEPLTIRIGHGFDIHRMTPVPLVVGGVEFTHSDQKWTDAEGKYVEKGGTYETQGVSPCESSIFPTHQPCKRILLN